MREQSKAYPECGMLVPSPFRAEAGDLTVAYLSLCSFVVIFVVAIVWATRPESKKDAELHGTREQSESLMHPGQK